MGLGFLKESKGGKPVFGQIFLPTWVVNPGIAEKYPNLNPFKTKGTKNDFEIGCCVT